MESNKLIAEFMGLKDSRVNDERNGIVWETQTKGLKYHTSWDWLMHVVETINTMDDFNYSVSINYHYTSITDNNTLYDIVDESADGNTIEGCYKAVVEFIKWYNKSKLNKDEK